MKILIVDDETPARDRLRQLVEDIDAHEVVAEAANGEQAVALVSARQPDVVLLDIRMPGLNGIDIAHHLNRMPKPPAIVFTTAYDEYAIEAFEAQAVGYVLKPVRRERLERALGLASRLAAATLDELAARSKLESRRRHVCARRQDQLRLIPIEDIHYFRAEQKYVCARHQAGEDLLDESLKSLEEAFADDVVRIHRSALVLVARIERLEKTTDGKYHVVLRGGSQAGGKDLIISRRHVADVRRRLQGIPKGARKGAHKDLL